MEGQYDGMGDIPKTVVSIFFNSLIKGVPVHCGSLIKGVLMSYDSLIKGVFGTIVILRLLHNREYDIILNMESERSSV